MQSLRVPVVRIERVEEIYPLLLGESTVSVLCRERNLIILFPGFTDMAKEIKIFLGSVC
jgi:hypothetical protein